MRDPRSENIIDHKSGKCHSEVRVVTSKSVVSPTFHSTVWTRLCVVRSLIAEYLEDGLSDFSSPCNKTFKRIVVHPLFFGEESQDFSN